MRRSLFLFLVGLATVSCGNNVGSTTQGPDRKDVPTMTAAASPLAPRASLPFEPRSRSELLSSSHLFTVEVTRAQATPWAVGPDGLEHRNIAVDLLLVALLKGRFGLPAGQTFSATIAQKREGELIQNDYQGLWSHVSPEPAPGVKYLIVATSPDAAAAAPEKLLQEPVCKLVLPPERANDVALAEQGEQHVNGALAAGGSQADVDAASALLRFAGSQAAAAGESFARYVWERVQPALLAHKGAARTAVLSLLAAPTTSAALRLQLLVGVERLLPEVQSGDPRFLRDAGHAMVTLLLDPNARAVHQRLVGVSLFHLVFPDEATAQVTAAEVVPDAAERAQLATTLRASKDPHAPKLLSWVDR